MAASPAYCIFRYPRGNSEIENLLSQHVGSFDTLYLPRAKVLLNEHDPAIWPRIRKYGPVSIVETLMAIITFKYGCVVISSRVTNIDLVKLEELLRHNPTLVVQETKDSCDQFWVVAGPAGCPKLRTLIETGDYPENLSITTIEEKELHIEIQHDGGVADTYTYLHLPMVTYMD